jgi:hypothetical protein
LGSGLFPVPGREGEALKMVVVMRMEKRARVVDISWRITSIQLIAEDNEKEEGVDGVKRKGRLGKGRFQFWPWPPSLRLSLPPSNTKDVVCKCGEAKDEVQRSSFGVFGIKGRNMGVNRKLWTR